MSQLSSIISQINALTGFNIPTGSGYIMSQSAQPLGSGSVNAIINYVNSLTGYEIPQTTVQYVSGANVAGPVIIYTPYAAGGTISTAGILPGQIIKAEHVLRIINALNGVNINDIIISGSLTTSGSNILNTSLALPFIGEGNYLFISGGQVTGTSTIPSATTASYAINAATASFAPLYLLLSATGSMLAPYVLTSSTSSMTVLSSSYTQTASFAPNYLLLSSTGSMLAPYVLTAITSSMLAPYVLTSSTSSMLAPYVLTTSTSSMLAPYVLTSSTGSMLAPYVLTSSTSSMTVLSSSYATAAAYAVNAGTASGVSGGKINHVPFFITDTTFATSSIYQSGSSTVVINQDSATETNPEALYVWQPSQTSFNVISGKGNLNNYLQLNIQNTNQGTQASSDVVATAHNGNESINYIDMGINGVNYNTGFIGGANDAYIYSTGNHLHIGNASNKPVMIFAGGTDVDANNKLLIDPNNQHELTGSLNISDSLVVNGGITGSLLGVATDALTASYTANYLPLTGGTINGNVVVNGTASVTFLNVTYESSSVIYSSGSNVFGDAANDVQTLYGLVNIPVGSLTVTGSLSTTGGITGSLQGTASYVTGSIFTGANLATSASYAITASYAQNVSTIETGSLVTTSSFNAFTSSVVTTSSFNAFTSSVLTTASFNSWTGSRTSQFAGTASYANTALYVETAQTASYVAAANVAGTVTSASYAVQAGNATTADYAAVAGNGGVTRLINGSGITLLPSSGVGEVTIIASAGGGVTIISGSLVTGSFVNTTSYTFNHNLSTRTPIITVFDTNYNQIIPQNIHLVDTASAIITFPTQESGFAIGSTGGTTGTALSSSYALFSTYATTASYYAETDPIFVAKSGSLATTGSNIFRGNQILTGSLLTSGSNTLIGNTVLTGSLSITGSTIQTGNNTLIGNTILSGSFEVSGSTILHNSTFIVTGSTFIKGQTQISGSTGITGSFEVRDGDINIVSGSSFTRWGNKLFNYGAFSDYTTQSGSANTVHAITFNTTDVALGINLSGSSAMKIENKGIYNFQWSGQLNQGAGASVVSVWLRVNGTDVPGSRGDVSLASNNNALPAWNYVLPFNANDAVELYWSSTSGNTTWVFAPVAINPPRPSTASIIATLTQIA